MSSATLIRFPVHSFRRIHTPLDEEGKKKYIIAVNVKDVPPELNDWRELNVRDPKERMKVPKNIQSSLRDEPRAFFMKNRGILILADGVEFDNKNNILKLTFGDKMMNGIGDGGHTYRVIRNYIDGLEPEELKDIEAYITIEVLEGFKTREEVVPIIEARNSSTPVQEQSIQELLGSYETIKDALKDKPYAERIYYKQYEEMADGKVKDIDIKEILSYLACFDVETYDAKTHPVKAYSSRSAVVESFTKNKDRLQKYMSLLPKILELRDIIYADLPEIYNAQGGNFGLLKGVNVVKDRVQKEELVFIGKESKYRIPSGFIYPILASLRDLVDYKGKTCRWKEDPLTVFEAVKEDLISIVGEQAKKFQNPQELGKDTATWRLCYLTTRGYIMEQAAGK